MGIEEWKEKRRENALNKVNRELERLKKKGLEFEDQPKKKEREVRIVRKRCSLLKVLAIILAVGWIVTFFIYAGRISNLKSDIESRELDLQLKSKEADELAGSLSNISVELEQKKKGEDELSDEIEDLLDRREALEAELDVLKDDMADLENQIDDLEVNLTTQENLVESYEDCITDDDGLDALLSVCDPFL